MTEKEYQRWKELDNKLESLSKEETREWSALTKEARTYERTQKNKKRVQESKKKAQKRQQQIVKDEALVNNSLQNSVDTDYAGIAEGYKKAAEQQLQDKIDKIEEQKLALDATLRGMETVSGLYGLSRGASYLNRYLAKKATQSVGQPISRDAMKRLSKAQRLVQQMDKAQTAMNSLGLTADIGQALTTEGPDYINDAEIIGDAAGIIGGLNIVRSTPWFGKYRNTIDNILDGMGYTAAAYDVVNNGNLLLSNLSSTPIEQDIKAQGGYLYAQGGEPQLHQSLSSLEQGNINNNKYRGIIPEVLYSKGGHLFDGYQESNQQMNDNTLVAPIIPKKPLLSPSNAFEKQQVDRLRKSGVSEDDIQQYLYTAQVLREQYEDSPTLSQGKKAVEESYKEHRKLGASRAQAAAQAASDTKQPFEYVAQVIDQTDPSTTNKIGTALRTGADIVGEGLSFFTPDLGALYYGTTGLWEAAKGNLGEAAQRGLMAGAPYLMDHGATKIANITGLQRPTVFKAAGIGTGIGALADMAQNGINTDNAFALGMGALPFYGPEAWRTAWYNNLTPGAYQSNISWHPDGKIKGELVQVLKDYLTGKGVGENPKWYDYFVKNKIFSAYPKGTKYPELEADLRREAFQIYNRLPHEQKYIIDTGKVNKDGTPIYTIDTSKLPKDLLQDYVQRIEAQGTTVRPDKYKKNAGLVGDFANIGGNAWFELENDFDKNIFKIFQQDVWDAHPFKDPKRIAESLPSSLQDLLFDKDVQVMYSYDGVTPIGSSTSFKLKDKFKWLQDMELGQLTGAKPFDVQTTISGEIRNKPAYAIDVTNPQEVQKLRRRIMQDFIDDDVQNSLSYVDDPNSLTQEEYDNIVKAATQQVKNYFNAFSDDAIIERFAPRLDNQQYAEKTGILNIPKEEINWKAKGGHLFADEGQMNEDTQTESMTGFGTWSPEDAAYNPQYDDRFNNVNWGNLVNYFLYEPQQLFGVLQKGYGPTFRASDNTFNKLNDRVQQIYQDAREQCMASTLNLQADMASLWGVPSMRGLLQDHYKMLPQYAMNSVQFDDNHKKTEEYTMDPYPNSWNFARSIAGLENGRDIGTVINMADYLQGKKWTPDMYLQFPLGTIFNIGDATRDDKKYIRDSEYGRKDEFGNLYPSHTYTLTTAIKDKDSGRLTPLLNDHSGQLWSDEELYPGYAPTYAIIPKGSEHLTMANILPRYEEYKRGFDPIKISEFDIKDAGNTANERFVKFLDYDELDRLRKKYNINGDFTPVMQRLLAIGAHESNLDNELSEDYGNYSKRNFGKHMLPDWVLAKKKDIDRGYTPSGLSEEELDEKQKEINSQYDDMPAYKHEMQIYRDLQKQGRFRGKTEDEIIQMVANEFNRQKQEWGEQHTINGQFNENYGKLPYNIRTISETNRNMSKTAFQMKPAKDFYHYDENGNKIKGSKSNVDDEYKGEKETLKAANRFFYLMREVKRKYPNLNREQVLDAATIAWNSYSKINDPDFIDFYIQNKNLRDEYLTKVIERQKKLYKKKYKGTKNNIKSGIPLVEIEAQNQENIVQPSSIWNIAIDNSSISPKYLSQLQFKNGGHLFDGDTEPSQEMYTADEALANWQSAFMNYGQDHPTTQGWKRYYDAATNRGNQLPEVTVKGIVPDPTPTHLIKNMATDIADYVKEDPIQSVLDVTGFIPGLDFISDIGQVGYDLSKGHWGDAALSTLAAGLPFITAGFPKKVNNVIRDGLTIGADARKPSKTALTKASGVSRNEAAEEAKALIESGGQKARPSQMERDRKANAVFRDAFTDMRVEELKKDAARGNKMWDEIEQVQSALRDPTMRGLSQQHKAAIKNYKKQMQKLDDLVANGKLSYVDRDARQMELYSNVRKELAGVPTIKDPDQLLDVFPKEVDYRKAYQQTTLPSWQQFESRVRAGNYTNPFDDIEPNPLAHGGSLNKYSKGTEHDLTNEEIFDLIKKGYKISYL